MLYFNIFFTLAFGLLSIRVLDKLKNKYLSCFIVFVFAVIAEILCFDFGAIGVLLIASFYMYKSKPNLKCFVQICLFIILFLKKSTTYLFTISNVKYILFQLMFSLIGLLFPYLYNGKKGKSSKVIQITFYAFYPVHLILLCLLKFLV